MATMGLGGGSYKGNSRGKPYGVMLLLAFGAALLGVLVIHKLRERRIFNLLLQDKDTQLLSLQLLLQKEKEYSKDMKRKTEEMKAKIYLLRNRKMETDRRILEMQSTIDSLNEERKIMESALFEKQDEIKLHTESSMYLGKGNTQTTSLTENLKQKETEIDDFKQNQLKMWSVTSDAQSNTQPDFIVTGNSADGDGKEGRLSLESINDSTSETSARGNIIDNASTTLINGENTTTVYDDRSERRAGNADKSVVAKQGQLEMPGNSVERPNDTGPMNESAAGKESIDNSQGNKNKRSQENSAVGSGGENEIANASEGIASPVDEVAQTGNAGMNPVYRAEHQVDRDGQVRHENPQQDQENSRGGSKLEMKNNIRSSPSRVKAKHAKGKRWKILARNRRLEGNKNYENNVAEGMRKGRFSRMNDIRDREGTTTSDKSRTDGGELMGLNKPAEESESFADAQSLESQNTADTVDQKNKPLLDKTNRLLGVSGKAQAVQISQTGIQLMSRRYDRYTNDIRSETETESSNEVEKYEDQDTSGIKKNREMNTRNSRGQSDAASKNERPEEIEAADIDHERNAATFDIYKESNSDLEEDKEEYEQTEEPEF